MLNIWQQYVPKTFSLVPHSCSPDFLLDPHTPVTFVWALSCRSPSL